MYLENYIMKYYLKVEFITQLSEDDIPCVVVDYSVSPKYDFQHLL